MFDLHDPSAKVLAQARTLPFELRRDPRLPRLAWLMTLGQGAPQLDCGTDIEVGADWFFEGAWAGPFAEGDFWQTSCFGTGGRVTRDGVLFTPPDHFLDRLCLYQTSDGVLVSNSLPFVLERAGRSLRHDISDYFERFADVRFGLDHGCTELPLAGGGYVTLWAWHHLLVKSDLSVVLRKKTRTAPLESFEAYEDYLLKELAAVFDNASDPSRQEQRYLPLSTLSRGYDSTAVTALAVEQGCSEALIFPKSRAKFGRPARDDSGAEAASALGVIALPRDRLAYRNRNDLPEIETMGAGSEFSSVKDDLSGRVLLTGHMGDTIWDRIPTAVARDLALGRLGGHNKTELRLASGFIHVPVPYLGGCDQPDIVKISQSEEMKPWSMGTLYDRPICRRIAEERGIPRHVFGQSKRATGVFFRDEGIRATMAPRSYADYTVYRRAVRPLPGWRVRLTDRWCAAKRVINSVLSRGTHGLSRLTGRRLRAPLLSDDPGLNGEEAFLFQWATARLKQRYRKR